MDMSDLRLVNVFFLSQFSYCPLAIVHMEYFQMRKLTIKTPERHEQISRLFLVFLLLPLNKYLFAGKPNLLSLRLLLHLYQVKKILTAKSY